MRTLKIFSALFFFLFITANLSAQTDTLQTLQLEEDGTSSNKAESFPISQKLITDWGMVKTLPGANVVTGKKPIILTPVQKGYTTKDTITGKVTFHKLAVVKINPGTPCRILKEGFKTNGGKVIEFKVGYFWPNKPRLALTFVEGANGTFIVKTNANDEAVFGKFTYVVTGWADYPIHIAPEQETEETLTAPGLPDEGQ